MNNVLKMNTDFSYVLPGVVFMQRESLVVQLERLAVQRSLWWNVWMELCVWSL